jgi:glycosyltransferase involved in cell wall biosynthesis
LLAKLKRCPFVLEVRDLWPDTLIKMNGLRNRYLIKSLTWLESFLYRRADKIVVLTEYQRRFIAEKGIDREKISLIPNGIVRDSWQRDPSAKKRYRQRMGVDPGQFVALYAGAHGPANALEHVVRAGRYLPKDSAIVLIGDGPEKDRLRRIKEEESLSNVYLLDPVPKGEIYHYIDAADCGIISLADNEIFRGARPNKLFDYMYIGKPIITNVDGEVREIVEANGVGLFSGVEDPRGLAEAMEKVKRKTDEEKNALAERASQYIDRYGDRKKLAQTLFWELLSLGGVEMEKVKEAKRSG